MSEEKLELRIAHRLGAFALDVAFEAGKGVTGIIGPSGAGKTTLLEAIAGLARPESGRIALGGEVFLDTERGIRLPPDQRRIGYVFQEARLFPHLSVARNLDYGATRRGAGGAISRDEVVALLGLVDLLARRPHRLSGGEAQRVAIGRALLAGPRLILMDEPLSSLDIRRRREIMPFIEALHRRLDLPILYVSHNIDEIVRLADRVVVMEGGKIVASGGVADVLNRSDIRSLILGVEASEADPATVIDARVARHDEAHGLTEVEFAGATVALSRLDQLPGGTVRLRLHARDIAIATERPVALSIQNVIEARVSGLHRAGAAQTDVGLVVGSAENALVLTARITTRAAERLALTPGQTVWALVKSVVLASDLARMDAE